MDTKFLSVINKMSLLILGFAAFYLNSCKHSDYKFVKLKDFRYTKAEIKTGTKIKLLAFFGTGGKTCTQDVTYYYQFIGIDTATGDTVRILAPCQEYDVSKRSRVGSFFAWDSTRNIINKIRPIGEGEDFKLNAKEGFVVINNNPEFLLFENRDFKTAIGTLGFKE